MKFVEEFSIYARTLARTVYPAVCPVCSKSLHAREIGVCASCLATFRKLTPPLCPLCARELPPFTTQRLCSDCRGERHYVRNTWSLLYYNDPLKVLLHQVKFRNRERLLYLFRRPIEQFAKDHLSGNFDWIVPVPLDFQGQWRRGFNQAGTIAEFVRRGLRKPVRSWLKKRGGTPAQSLLGRKERLENLRNRFKVRNETKIKGRNILLVDDIYTTGATVNECARVLRESGAASVSVFTLARAGSERN